MKAAAVQLTAILGDVEANLDACEELGDQAGRAGAEIIALPEFFTTGIGFDERLARTALPVDGAATALLTRLARRYQALVGGSFLCRDQDGHVRNAYILAGPDGVIGRHDKDLPTMWENAFYIGGSDEGVLDTGDFRVGAAVCWELMRTATARRLEGRVDLIMAGSGWWSVPRWLPRVYFDREARRNADLARHAVASFSRFVGAPMVHAGHAGPLECATPWLPLRYRGHFEGATMITDADGTILAERRWHEGSGVVLADIPIGARPPVHEVPQGFWLHPRGSLATATWTYQRWHGRRWYQRHTLTEHAGSKILRGQR